MNEIYDDNGNIYIWSNMENCLKKINKDENIRTKDIASNAESKLLLLIED